MHAIARTLAALALLCAPLAAAAQTPVAYSTRRDARLEAALRAEALRNGPVDGIEGELRYFYNRVDLDGDGRPEVIAYVAGPWVCGSGGCAVYVLREANGRYAVLSALSLGRTPVVVSPRSTRGWRDLIVPVSGGGARAGYAVLRFDGARYPWNPSTQPAAPAADRRAGTAYLAGDVAMEKGALIPMRP